MGRSSLRMPSFNVVICFCQTVSPTNTSTLKRASLREHGCKVHFDSGGSQFRAARDSHSNRAPLNCDFRCSTSNGQLAPGGPSHPFSFAMALAYVSPLVRDTCASQHANKHANEDAHEHAAVLLGLPTLKPGSGQAAAINVCSNTPTITLMTSLYEAIREHSGSKCLSDCWFVIL